MEIKTLRWKSRQPAWRSVVVVLALGMLAVPPVSAQTPATTIEYYHVDAVGSVRAVTDASGAVIRHHEYRPFGEGENPPAGADAVRFTGQARDAETGLDYVGARYYASRIGRFTTVDPGHVGGNIFDPQSWNAYAYARNNPLRFVDPTGTEYEVRLGNGTTMYLTNDQFDRLSDYPGAGISFDDGGIWINNGATKYGSYRYYYGFSDAIRDAGNRAASELKTYVKEMAINAATTTFFASIRMGAVGLYGPLKQVTNPRLKKSLEQIFQVGDELAGGTAGAVRTERWSGGAVAGRTHTIKALERTRELEKILQQESLTRAERRIAEEALQNLRSAVGK